MRPRRAFTLVEAVVLLVLFVAVIAIALAVVPQRTLRHPPHNNSHLRGIHQAMVMYAQGNNSYFPGLDADGNDRAVAVEDRLQILLEQNYFTGEYLVSPSETKTAWTTGPLTAGQYSYAFLQLPTDGHRRAEWRETLSTEAAVGSDRAVYTDGRLHSVHTDSGSGWRGSVVYNDNHVIFESTHVLPTRNGPGVETESTAVSTYTAADDLFTADSTNDAYLIHSGNE